MSTGDITWPTLIGYRHEIMHTGVLRYLIGHPEHGPEVASALAGADVAAVLDVRTEAAIPAFKGRADLVADVRLLDGSLVGLAVETKVDSNASYEQITATAEPPQLGVLLALGVTALAIGDRELADNAPGWRAFDPGRWAAILDRCGAEGDSLLGPYATEVRREAREHAAARELARRDGAPSERVAGARREDGLLEHYAWLAEIRDRLDDAGEWWTYTNRSGPLMGLWRDDFQQDGRDTFIEFMCSDRERILCLKIGGGDGDLHDSAEHALSRVRGAGWQPGRRRPSASAQTCTAAYLDLSGIDADTAARRSRQAIAEVGAAPQ
jgi:hypothetical protein